MMNNQFMLSPGFNSFGSKGSYLRPVVDVSRQLKQLRSVRLGLRYTLEKNEIRNTASDSLSPLSFAFDTYTAYLKSDEARKNRYGLTFYTRSDKYPIAKSLLKGDRSYNTNFEAQLLRNQHHQVLFSATYRVLKVLNNPGISNQKDDRTALGKDGVYLINEWKGLVTGNVLYELGTGQEQKRDFAYFEVPAGQGEYTWIDYNRMITSSQLNEFEISHLSKDQAKFIRIFVPTNQFIKANYTTLNYSFTLNPRAILNAAASTRNAQIRFHALTWQTSMQKVKKSIAHGDFPIQPVQI